MTSSLLGAPPAAAPEEARGQQLPRITSGPAYSTSAGVEVVELARLAGLVLDPWEAWTLEHALGERPDGKWAAFEVGLIVSRQNGKGAILEARELGGLFLLGERLIVHTAHLFDTALEAFRRILYLIENTPDLDRRVRRVSRSHGEEGIELKSGARLRFKARTGGSGRGFSGDLVILDEAMDLPEPVVGALMPTVSARPNPQLWYTGSAADRRVHAHCQVLGRVRERGLAGDPGLFYAEWSVDGQEPGKARPGEPDRTDPAVWAQANPAQGIRISAEHIAREQRSMEPRTFDVERLGIGDWPTVEDDWQVITEETWSGLADPGSAVQDPVSIAVDVAPDRSTGSISVAGRRTDGLRHVEVIDRRPGVKWIVKRVVDLRDRWSPCAIVLDAAGPAGGLLADLEEAGVEVVLVSAREAGQACGGFYDGTVDAADVRHLDQPELNAALAGARRRPLGDAWAWDRKAASVDLSPLVAVTLALWGHAVHGHGTPDAPPNLW